MVVFRSLAHWLPSYAFKKKGGGGSAKSCGICFFIAAKKSRELDDVVKGDSAYIIPHKNQRAQSLADLTMDRVPVLFPSISCVRITAV